MQLDLVAIADRIRALGAIATVDDGVLEASVAGETRYLRAWLDGTKLEIETGGGDAKPARQSLPTNLARSVLEGALIDYARTTLKLGSGEGPGLRHLEDTHDG